MASLRHWSTRHADGLERLYRWFEDGVKTCAPLLSRLGITRLEAPVALIERGAKSLMFDCRMCGQCALSATGMTCSMTCPKTLRNGPCGGVRQNGHCEIKPEMPCVWLEAWKGAEQMSDRGARMKAALPPLDWRRLGRSSWLALARDTVKTS